MNARTLLLGAVLAAVLCLPSAGEPAARECGPGPLLMQGSGGIVQQLLAFSTNGTFLPTYAIGITVGTSGCNNSGVVDGTQAATEFVAFNAEHVERDFARGQGEYMASVAALLGCPAEARPDFARVAQAHMAARPAPAEAAPAQWVAQVQARITAEPALAASCQWKS